jgi:hypothetical protein
MRVYKEYPRPFLLEETKLTSIVNKIHEQLDDHAGTIRADQFDVFLPRNRTQQASSVEEVLRLENSRDYLCYYDGSDGSVRKTIQGIEGPAVYSAIWWDPRNGGFTGPSIHFDCVTDHTVTLSAPDAADWVLLLRKVKDC